MGSTGFAFSIGDEWGTAAGARPGIPDSDWGFPDGSVIWLLPGREVAYSICNILGTLSRHFKSCSNVVAAGAATFWFVCSSTAARTLNWEMPYVLSHSQKSIGCVPPSWWCQFVKLQLSQPKPLHVLLYCFEYCAHRPAGFVIFAQLALLYVFIILIFTILPMLRTCNIAQTIFDSNNHLMTCYFRLSGRQSRIFTCLCIILLLPSHCLCVFNLLSCPSGFTLIIILHPFLFLFVV